jgi:hypothetical protein
MKPYTLEELKAGFHDNFPEEWVEALWNLAKVTNHGMVEWCDCVILWQLRMTEDTITPFFCINTPFNKGFRHET